MKTEFIPAERIDKSDGLDEYGCECFSMYCEGFEKLTGPGVYVAARGSGETFETLYIGSAKNLLARISDPAHASLRQAFKFKDCRLLLTICKSEKHARDTESILIATYQPKLNIAGKSMQETAEGMAIRLQTA